MIAKSTLDARISKTRQEWHAAKDATIGRSQATETLYGKLCAFASIRHLYKTSYHLKLDLEQQLQRTTEDAQDTTIPESERWFMEGCREAFIEALKGGKQ